jgi:hypothetical protein
VGLDEDGEYIHAFQVFWKKSFMNYRDEKGARMDSRMG